jgi:molecular chaperone GrpE
MSASEESQNGAAPSAPEEVAGSAAAADSADELTTLRARLDKAEADRRELHDRLLRTAADFENWKRRSRKEQEEASTKGRDQVVKEMLPVIDNLERALKHAPGDDPLAQGVRMVEREFLRALDKFGITRFSALGQPFDPNLHDAIQQVETDATAPNTVALEFASGYLSSGKLLRAALVAVAKAPPGASPPSNDHDGSGDAAGG